VRCVLILSRLKARRALIVPAVAAAALLQMAVVGVQAAHADPVTLTVVGTSDVSDSGLMGTVIAPGFSAATNGAYAIKYIGEGTGAAIADAEAGNGAALIVHAPSLENQFVSGGYSFNNDYGRAIFWGDYVLAGATADPAGIVANKDQNNIVKSYEDVANAGLAGKAVFVSRGGTPGTTVAEHQIWAQMNSVNEVPTGVQLCMVSTANGGGMTPIQPGSTGAGAAGAACPSTVVPPSWYVVTGSKQAANIHQADVCSYSTTGANDCYVFTDRGTYDNVQGGSNPLSTPATNLSLFTQNDTVSTEDPTKTLLINSFHAYVVNPAATSGSSATNTAGGTALLNYLTSPTAQAAIAGYQIDPNTKLPDFRPDAQPKVTPIALPDVIDPSSDVTLTGSVQNVVPGTPALAGVTVTLMGQVTATPSAAPVVVATANTGHLGNFTMSFSAPVERTYTLTTPALNSVLEYPLIHPPFGDQLQATSTPVVTTSGAATPQVQGGFRSVKASGKAGKLTVSGSLVPKERGTAGTVALYAKVATGSHAYHLVSTQKLADGAKTFTISVQQQLRAYNYYVQYANPGYIETGTSTPASVTVVS
jgi:tungstate transport system substrate-binding protein